MKQVFVLERTDLQRLKEGQSLVLNTPDGRSIEIFYEKGKAVPSTSHESLGSSKERVLNYVKEKGEARTADVYKALPDIQVNNIRNILYRLVNSGKLTNKNGLFKPKGNLNGN